MAGSDAAPLDWHGGATVRLQDQVAIITGGAQGIGREYALRFAREGAAVVVADLRESQAREVEAEIVKAGGRAMAVRADVTDQAQMSEVAGQVAARFGTIDVLVNNAAIYYDLDLTNQSLEYGRQVLDVNLFGIIIAARAVFPWMKRQSSGAIINIATVGAFPPG